MLLFSYIDDILCELYIVELYHDEINKLKLTRVCNERCVKNESDYWDKNQ